METTDQQQVRAEIGERLREERKRLKLTVEAAVRDLDVGRTAYFSYEGGSAVPGADVLNRMDRCGFDVSYVVTGRRVLAPADENAQLVARMAALPPRMRSTVTDVLVLAEVAFVGRERYHGTISEDGQFTFGGSVPTSGAELHETAPPYAAPKRPRKP